MQSADYWIEKLSLTPHPEGGYYREIYRAPESVLKEALPERFEGSRPFSTSIFFLLKSGQVSRLHRLKSDEIWHFYEGCPVQIHLIHQDGRYSEIKLGRNSNADQVFQAVIPAGTWFGAEVLAAEGYALVGCTVAPGFDFADFELGRRDQLLSRFPRLADQIRKLT